MAARIGIVIANVGNTPTFRRAGCNGTIPDITMISEKSANSLSKWRVLAYFIESDHNYIAFTIDDGQPNSQSTEKNTLRNWNLAKIKPDLITKHVKI